MFVRFHHREELRISGRSQVFVPSFHFPIFSPLSYRLCSLYLKYFSMWRTLTEYNCVTGPRV